MKGPIPGAAITVDRHHIIFDAGIIRTLPWQALHEAAVA